MGIGGIHRGLERGLRPTSACASAFGNHVPSDLEQPHPERGGALAVVRPGAFVESVEVGQGGQERPFRRVLRLVMVAQLVPAPWKTPPKALQAVCVVSVQVWGAAKQHAPSTAGPETSQQEPELDVKSR